MTKRRTTMAKVKIKEKETPKGATLAERWAEDKVPFRVFRDGKWLTPQELAEADKKEKSDG